MPIYEYHCCDCQAEFSRLRSMSAADAPLECQVCQGGHVQRKLSRIAAVHKSGNGDAGGSGGSSGGCASCGSHNCATCGH